MEYINPWLYLGEVFDSEHIDKYVGFVYKIKNRLNGKQYIGKKLFHFMKTKQVNKKKKRIKVESDWKEYYGSNKLLQDDVSNANPDDFIREILFLGKTKGECNYMEAKYQFDFDVLRSSMWYNDQIRVRVHSSHLKNI
jgi:hypothetical protein